MPVITCPTGRRKIGDQAVTAAQVAADIGLATAALAARMGTAMIDLDLEIAEDMICRLSRRAMKIFLLRHDAAHVMAEAVLELYPETQVTIGPSIENGFYYDFYRETPFSTDDLLAIETRTHEIVDRKEAITREVWSRDQAVAFYKENNEPFKVELVDAIPADETVTFYRQGGFIDLCRGPHKPTTGHLGHAFKLMKVAGAYWRVIQIVRCCNGFTARPFTMKKTSMPI